MSTNQEMIEKAITTTTLSQQGGQLNNEQQERFVALIRRFGVMLSLVRFERMGQPNIDIDKLHIGEPVTVGATEATGSTESFSPKFNKITLSATKLRSDWSLTTETLQSNIEQDQLEATVMRGITERMATDFELLGIQGDTSISSPSTPLDKLLSVTDGWDIQSDSAHIVDVGGGNISKAVFSTMLRQMPKEFKNDGGKRFFIGDDMAVDWQDTLSDRATALGDAALGQSQSGLAPYGVPLQVVPLIPDNKTISNQSPASAAQKLGGEFGPFHFESAADIAIAVDQLGGGDSPSVTVNLTTGSEVLDAVVVAEKINSALVADANYGAAYGNVARVTTDGRILLVSPTVGTTSSLWIGEGLLESPDTEALTILGFTAGEDEGAAAGSGSTLDGTFMWLGNPRNFIYGVLDGTRIFTEFNRNQDQIEATIFNQVAYNIENLSALVKATNLKRREAF